MHSEAIYQENKRVYKRGLSLKLGISYAFLTIPFVIWCLTLLQNPNIEDLPENATSRNYFQYDTEVDRLLQADSDAGPVLVGACQANFLKRLDGGSFNLGLLGGGIVNVSSVLDEYYANGRNNSIYYLLNLANFADTEEISSRTVNPIFTNRTRRKCAIARELVIEKLGLGEFIFGPKPPPDFEIFPEIREHEVDEVRALWQQPEMDRDIARYINYQLLAYPNREADDASAYLELAQHYSNLTYIILPSATAFLNHGEGFYGNSIKRMQKKEHKIIQMLEEGGATINLGLYNVLTFEDYKDVDHLTEKGSEKVRRFLYSKFRL
jgi:hypothetical protein